MGRMDNRKDRGPETGPNYTVIGPQTGCQLTIPFDGIVNFYTIKCEVYDDGGNTRKGVKRQRAEWMKRCVHVCGCAYAQSDDQPQ